MQISRLLPLISLLSLALAATLNVGSGKTYSTITAAYNAASSGDTIVVYPGTYSEKLSITKSSITIKGSTYPSLNPSENSAVMTYATYASASGSDDSSATLLVSGSNFKMYNMNITNTAGTGGQAVALSATGTSQSFYACALKAYQDTLYSHTGTQYFSRCYIEGAIDFIFGRTGQSWYQGCTLGVLRGSGCITAQGRQSSSDTGYFVFNDTKIILGNGAASGTKGAVYLGRPWGDYAQVVFQNTDEGNMITAAGWEPWTSTQSTTNILFGEYDDTDNSGTRVSWAKKLTSPVAITTILSSYASWVDSAYLGLGPP